MPSPKCKKALLVLLGLLLALPILEIGLRLGGFTLTALQENRNRISLKAGSDYRILCLGESTTQGEYPPFLEADLNKNGGGLRFSVLDQGKRGTNTTIILSQAEAFLDRYHPDMVVAMMGINDGAAPHLPHENPSASTTTLFFSSLKIYKLARLLWLHGAAGSKESDLDAASARGKRLEKALELNPRDEEAYLELGDVYQRQGRFAQAEASLKKLQKLNPRNEWTYLQLGNVYQQQGRFAQAEASLKKLQELNPRNEGVYVALGKVYQYQGRLEQAEASLKKALELDPKDEHAYIELGEVREEQGRPLPAEASFEKAQKLDPGDEKVYISLGRVYQQQGQLQQAERWLKKGLEFSDPHARSELYGQLAAISEKGGQIAHAREYCGQASRWDDLANNDPATARNYRALKAMLDKRKIRLVCVQYPMRPVATLKKIFAEETSNIIFVDNEVIFRNATRRKGLNAYFKDMFGGNFGHCTDEGNRLLGGNIAKVILREAFGK